MMKDRMKPKIARAVIYMGLFGISLSVSGKPPGPPVTDVNVVNAPSVEVSNTPDVHVTNTPDVNVVNTQDVNVSNTPDVNVINTQDVNVVNTPSMNVTNVLDVNIANIPDVNVANTLDVNITNTRPITVKASNIYRFIGFSAAKLIGKSGVATLHSACQSNFGAGARMCTSKEIFETPGLSSVATGQGWTHPVVVSEILNSANKRVIRDFSGLSATTLSMSCDGWSSVTSGVIYTAGEGYRVADCSVARNVSCCIPQ